MSKLPTTSRTGGKPRSGPPVKGTRLGALRTLPGVGYDAGLGDALSRPPSRIRTWAPCERRGTSSGYCSDVRYFRAVPRALAIALAAAVALLACIVLTSVQASALGTPSDAAATRTFLEAADVWLQSSTANVPASAASMQAFVQKVGAECPDVFRNAPTYEQLLRSRDHLKGRQRRVLEHEVQQSKELVEELAASLEAASREPDRSATASFVATVTPLHWSESKVTRSVRSQIAQTQAETEGPPPSICADIKSWVESGYKTLSAATRGFHGREVALQRAYATSRTGAKKLNRYEQKHFGGLLRRLESHLRKRAVDLDRLERAIQEADESLRHALGLFDETGVDGFD
jgi:hypothetical protein